MRSGLRGPVLLLVALHYGCVSPLRAAPGGDLATGLQQFQEGRYADALSIFQDIVARDAGELRVWDHIGWSQYYLGRTNEAVRVWKNVLSADPGRFKTHNAVGYAMLAGREYEEAVRCFQESLRLQAEQPNIRLRLGESLEGLQRWDDAAREYEFLVKADPRNASAILHWSNLLLRTGRVDAAVAGLTRAVENTPDLPAAVRREIGKLEAIRGDAAFNKKNYEEALHFYEKARKWDEANPRYLVNLGWSQRRQGRPADAIASWQQAVAMNPAFPDRVYLAMADTCREMGRGEEANRYFEKARELKPNNPNSLLRLGEMAFASKSADQAEGYLANLFELPGLDETWAVRAANLFAGAGEAGRGVEFFNRRRGPEGEIRGRPLALAVLFADLGGRAYRAGAARESVAFYRRALECDPENPRILRDLGWACWKNGQWEDCAAAWQTLAKVRPDDAESHDLLARVHLACRRYDAAAGEADRSLALSPRYRPARIHWIHACFGTGRLSLACAKAQQMVQETPGDLTAQTLLAQVWTRMCDFPRARDQWRRVLDMEPRSAIARVNWIQAMYQSGEADKALELARAAVAAGTPPPALLQLLAQDAEVRKDHEAALRWYSMLTDACPNEPSFWIGAARSLTGLGRNQAAGGVLQFAEGMCPGSLDVARELSWWLADNDRLDEAVRRFEALVRKNPDSFSSFSGLADTLERSRRYADALTLLSRNQDGFFTPSELAMRRARLLKLLARGREAGDVLERIARPPAGAEFVPVLVYHGLSPYGRSLSTSSAVFADHMAALRAQGYQAVTVSELALMTEGKKAFPPRPVLITFDDARTDSFRQADPILAQYGMRATMFVPTSRIGAEDLFHAGWESLRKYAANGRWDLQSHGHEAHNPIAVSADGRTGIYLASRAWLPAENRNETESEFHARVEQDYARSCALLRQEIPGQAVVGFAFPFSEFGQGAHGTDAEAAPFNQAVVKRLFRFGFVQDENGYNMVDPGSGAPSLWRRFSVPHDWSGEKLVAHLARRQPDVDARMMEARLQSWAGRVDSAAAAFMSMEQEEPLLAPECDRALADIAMQRGRPWEAAERLRAHTQPMVTNGFPLAELAWAMNPRIELGVLETTDSDHREETRFLVAARSRTGSRVTLSGGAGFTRLREEARSDVSGPNAIAGLRWAAGGRTDLSGWLRESWLEPDGGGLEGGVGCLYRNNVHEVRLNWSDESVNTVRARLADVDFNQISAGYTANSRHWLVRAAVARREFSDGNGRNDLRLAALYRPVSLANWRFGGDLEYSDSEYRSDFYYAPMGVVAPRATAGYRYRWISGSTLDLEAGLGMIHDDTHGERLGGKGRLSLDKVWTSRMRTSLDLYHNTTPTYHSSGVELLLQLGL